MSTQPSPQARLRVTRGPDRDVAEWVEPEPGAAPVYTSASWHVGSGERPVALFALVAVILAFGLALIVIGPGEPGPRAPTPLSPTIADLAPVHAGVRVGTRDARVLGRLAEGDVVETDAAGRARLRLDGGATLVIDGGTRLVAQAGGVSLERGRVFVVAGPEAAATVDLGVGSVHLADATAGFERGERVRVYAASGELTARAGGAERTTHAGESAVFADGKVEVVPERRFDDWTGGLAAPWGADGQPRRAIGELWGRATPGAPGSPLTVRKHEVEARVEGELAETTARTTFFHAGDATVRGDFRLALPRGAIVSGFATTRNGVRRVGSIALADRPGAPPSSASDALEWAGDGWVRGRLDRIDAGEAVTVEIQYVEWLAPEPHDGGWKVQYRYPFADAAAAPLVGELFLRVDAEPSNPASLAAGWGARVDGAAVEVRRADARPSADFVVDVHVATPLPPARAYLAPGRNDEEAGRILVRTEAPLATRPEQDGVVLSILLDASSSLDPSLFDASRAFVEALVKSLGPADRVVVLASDAVARDVGPDAIVAADDAGKAAILGALAGVSQGGATDLGRALEEAAAAIPEDAPSGMVVYVGDGWPSIGDRGAEAIRARLARRPAGVPRLGAVTVGPSANKPLLAALVRGSGPLVEIADSEDAARAAVDLLERAIVPTVTGVSVDLGPRLARVFPRGEVAAPRGATITWVGELAGDAPANLTLTWREGTEQKTARRKVAVSPSSAPADVTRRHAALRVETFALEGRGREAITDVAFSAGLLTPWTSLVIDGGPVYAPSPLETRVLDLTAQGEAGLAAALGAPSAARSIASDRDLLFSSLDATEEVALRLAAIRVLGEARAPLRACRDTRAALRPDLPPSVEVSFDLDGDGRALDVKVAGAVDEALGRCVATVVEGLAYPRMGGNDKVRVVHVVVWPPLEPLRGRTCSLASVIAVPLRRGLWQEAIDAVGPVPAFLAAKRACELSTWTAKRSFLELVLAERTRARFGWPGMLDLASALDGAGDPEAAAFLRKETLRRVPPEALASVRRRLLETERLPLAAFLDRYRKAADDRGRLEVVRRFLVIAPHDGRLRGRLVALYEALGEKQALLEDVRRLRTDPFADAVLLADAAAALRRLGLEDEARRTFGEIAEGGAHDPWAQAFLGDRLRAEGLFDDAGAAYAALSALVPQDGPTGVRLALAHAGAGRLDVALRTLARVSASGGRDASTGLAELSGVEAQRLVREALGRPELGGDDRRLLERALAELPTSDAVAHLLVASPPGRDPVGLVLERGPEGARTSTPPDVTTGPLGLALFRLDPPTDGVVTLSLRRPEALVPEVPFRVELVVLGAETLEQRAVELPADGARIEVRYDGRALGEPKRVVEP